MNELANLLSTPATFAGVSFIPTISVGHILGLAVTILSFAFGAGKLFVELKSNSKKINQLAKEVAEDRELFREALKKQDEMHREELADCREQHNAQLAQVRGSLDNLAQNIISLASLSNQARAAKMIEETRRGALSEQFPSNDGHR